MPKKPARPEPRRGRPRLDTPPAERCRTIGLTLPESTINILRAYGNGSASAGARRICAWLTATGSFRRLP